MQLVIMNRGWHRGRTNEVRSRVDDARPAGPVPADPVPADPVIAWLTTTIEQTLHCGPLAPDDDFFDHGGDSMSALSLFAAIEDRFGVALPLTTIYDAPTIAGLAALIIAGDTTAAQSCLVPIRQGSMPGAVILIHGIGGHVFDLRQLGGAIQTRQHVAALRACGLEAGETPRDRIAAMADAYAELIAQHFPNQPIHLIGYSFGGMIAIETARRLQSKARIGAVVLLDTYPHPHRWPRIQALDVRLRRIRHQCGVLLRADRRTRMDYLKTRLGRGSPQQAAAQTGWLAVPGGVTAGIRSVWIANSAAIDHYHPARFDHPVTFVKPQARSVFLPTNPRAVWHSTLPHLTIEPCPGDHITMLDRHASALAALLSHLITESPPTGNDKDASAPTPQNTPAQGDPT